jgi:hypothetical protein
MSRYLSELLEAPEPAFSHAIRELEAASGNTGVDIRLTSELEQKAKAKYRELGIDPVDSTSKELYRSLQLLVAKHDAYVAKFLGVNDPEDVEAVLRRIERAIEKLNIKRSAWVLKPVVARRLLKAQPPKKVMKQLGYRSVDSMLKRESITELFVGARVSESADWLIRLVKSYKKLEPSDFETRDIEVIRLSTDRWGKSAHNFVAAKRANVTHLKELGVVAILPLPVERLKGVSLTVLLLILHYIDEIRSYSTYFKLRQVKPDFAEVLVRTILHDPSGVATIVGRPIHWRTVRRHFGSSKATHPDIFQPHLQPEDLAWATAESTLYMLEPALKFWEDLSFVGVPTDQRPVSFNLLDNAISYCNGLGFGHQAVYHFQTSLWNELIARYLGEKNLEASLLAQLEESLAEPGLLPATEGIYSI